MAKAKGKISSEFGMIDVKAGRKALAKRIRAGEAVRMVIEMVLEDQTSIGNDDGVSIEFYGTVVSAEEIVAPKTRRGAK